MHTHPLALVAFQGPAASKGVMLFVIVLTALLILMIYAVVRAPAWQPPRPSDGAGPGPGDRPAPPLPRRHAQDPDPASSVFDPTLSAAQTGRHAAPASALPASTGPASPGPASPGADPVAPVPHPVGAGVPAGAPAARGLTTRPAQPDPLVLERPVVTGRPPWGPAPRPPGMI